MQPTCILQRIQCGISLPQVWQGWICTLLMKTCVDSNNATIPTGRTNYQQAIHAIKGARRATTHLPLHNGIADLQIGVSPTDAIARWASCVAEKIVWYGTSIAQGGVVSRPGLAFTNQIARNLSVDIFNFGFSGSCLMEIGVMQWLAEIDASAFIIDCVWNMEPQMIANRTIPLVKYLRSKNPHVPIIIAEGTTAGAAWIETSANEEQVGRREALLASYNTLKSGGDTNLFYVKREDLYRIQDGRIAVDPDQYINPTVGGAP